MGAIGDFYRAVRALGPNEAELALIAQMLGLELRGPAAATPRAPEEPVAAPPLADESTTATSRPSEYFAFAAKPVEGESEESPAWLAGVTPLPPERAGYRATQLPFDPLLPQNKSRALLSTLLARPVEEGPIDVPRLISAIARGKPLERLYRLRSLTVRHGVQLLVDRGESMALFSRDARWLVKELQNVIGTPRVEVLLYADCPSRGVGAPAQEAWREYRPPAAGTPVLLLTDLGIGATPIARASQAEWESFFATLRAAACPLFALVPYASARWPASLTASISAIVWDRTTTVQLVRQATSARRRRA